MLLRKRQADQLKRKNQLPGREGLRGPQAAPDPAARGGRPPGSPPPTRQTLAALRRELNGLIAAWHHRTGQSHGAIHAELRRACGGPPLPETTAAQIEARIGMLRRWASSGR